MSNEYASSYRSTFGQTLTVRFEDYSGRDFSSCCLLFPAQSSAHPGIFARELAQYREFKAFFARTDGFAHSHGLVAPSLYITSPRNIPDEQLSTIRALCLFASGYAMFHHLVNSGTRPTLITGHSFGEFGAMAASGVIEFVDMLEIILLREQSCPPPHRLGYLLSISSPHGDLPRILPSSVYEIAGRNSPLQTVIGVAGLDEVKALEAELKGKGILYKRLANVPQPYHTSLMRDCGSVFTGHMAALSQTFRPPDYPFYSSVLQRRIDRQNFSPELILSALSMQLTEPIDLITQIKAIYSQGIYGFLEVGPGTVFSQLVAEILGERRLAIIPLARAVHEDKEDVKEYHVKDNKLLERVSAIIARLTGYELKYIHIRKRLQDDMGIDSIKKAEILLTVLEEEGVDEAASIDPSEIDTIYDLGEAVLRARYAGKLVPHSSRSESVFERYRFVERESPASRLFVRENCPGEDPIQLSLSALIDDAQVEIRRALHSIEPHGHSVVVLLFDRDDGPSPVELSLKFFGAIRALLTGLPRPFHLVACALHENLLFTAAGAFFKSLKREGALLSFASVLTDDQAHLPEIALEASRELSHFDLSYKGGKRYVKIMEPEKVLTGDEERGELEGAVIVAIGGAKGITHSLLKHISAERRLRIAVIGRSSPESLVENLASLRSGRGEITYHQGDASRFEDLLPIIQAIYDRYGRIDYILHGAGYQEMAPFSSRSESEMAQELTGKLGTAHNILRLGGRFKVRKIVWFSSIVAWSGNSGQTIYTFANSALNYLAQVASMPVLSIMWPPWNGVGMMHDGELLRKMNAFGITLLSEERAHQLFIDDLVSPRSMGTILYHDQATTHLYWNPLLLLHDYKSILGTFVYQREISFQQDIIPGSNSFLKEEEPQGVFALPLAYVLSVIMLQSYFLSGRMARCTDFSLFNRLSFRNAAVVAYNYEIIDQDRLAITINSFTHGQDGVSSHGRSVMHVMERIGNDECSAHDMPDFSAFRASLREADRRGNSRTRDGVISSVLHDLYLDKDGNYVASRPISGIAAPSGCRGFDALLAALELALELAALAVYNERHIRFLPVSLSSLRLDDSVSWDMTLFARLTNAEFDGAHMRADVSILAEDGTCLAVLSGIELSAMNSGSHP
jgi:malonyl CoA-acyl carrier protein transacylase